MTPDPPDTVYARDLGTDDEHPYVALLSARQLSFDRAPGLFSGWRHLLTIREQLQLAWARVRGRLVYRGYYRLVLWSLLRPLLYIALASAVIAVLGQRQRDRDKDEVHALLENLEGTYDNRSGAHYQDSPWRGRGAAPWRALARADEAVRSGVLSALVSGAGAHGVAEHSPLLAQALVGLDPAGVRSATIARAYIIPALADPEVPVQVHADMIALAAWLHIDDQLVEQILGLALERVRATPHSRDIDTLTRAVSLFGRHHSSADVTERALTTRFADDAQSDTTTRRAAASLLEGARAARTLPRFIEYLNALHTAEAALTADEKRAVASLLTVELARALVADAVEDAANALARPSWVAVFDEDVSGAQLRAFTGLLRTSGTVMSRPDRRALVADLAGQLRTAPAVLLPALSEALVGLVVAGPTRSQRLTADDIQPAIQVVLDRVPAPTACRESRVACEYAADAARHFAGYLAPAQATQATTRLARLIAELDDGAGLFSRTWVQLHSRDIELPLAARVQAHIDLLRAPHLIDRPRVVLLHSLETVTGQTSSLATTLTSPPGASSTGSGPAGSMCVCDRARQSGRRQAPRRTMTRGKTPRFSSRAMV